MTKDEYLKNLGTALSASLSGEEVADILRDYEEYFDEGQRQDQPEKEIAERLGSPWDVAKQIIAETYIDRANEQPSAKNIFRAHGAVKVFSIAAFLLSFPLMFLAAGAIIALILLFLLLIACSLAFFTGVLFLMGAVPTSATALAIVIAVCFVFASITVLLLIIAVIRRFLRWMGELFAKAAGKQKPAAPIGEGAPDHA